MKQVIQDFKTGKLFVADVPAPSIKAGFVLVRNKYSLLSSGTERTTVKTGQASLLGKARQRPDLVKQVLDNLKREGLKDTLIKVRTKLESFKELGYSSAGVVLMSMDTRNYFKPGDNVACCGGGYASHADIIAVPQNLVVKIPQSVPLDRAAFTTIGAIAVQGVRQAAPRLGESVCVIGLGLIGQITGQILKANGCQVFGIDTASEMVALAEGFSCHKALPRDHPDLNSAIDHFTQGHGFDSVIITASSKTADPIELSTAISRQKGVIVLVGAVPINIPRDPHFYRKELEFKISCSYGPGRYDHSYEEEGIDYPYGYVRWTEKRNMMAFLQLLENGSVDVKPLVTHTFDIDEAEKAYDIITGKVKERHIGILLRYPEKEEPGIFVRPTQSLKPASKINIGFIGAGSFAQKCLIPYAKELGLLSTVVTTRGATAKSVADKFNFHRFSTDIRQILSDDDINLVFVATRHNTHAATTVEVLNSGKNVFVEKPLALTQEELDDVARAYKQSNNCRLMVGFNRRFSELAKEAKNQFSGVSDPIFINYRVNAGYIPGDHWIQTAEGGGRILGEVCHFVDFMQFITGSNPVKVFAECISSQNELMNNSDNVAITISFSNGSVGVITYVSTGDKQLEKERIEIFGGGHSFIINDFRLGEAFFKGRKRQIKKPGKGFREEVAAFVNCIKDGFPSPIEFESLYRTTLVTFKVLDSLRTGLPQVMDF